MDKQARVALAEHVVYCRRLDRVTLPFIGSVYSLFTGNKLPLPKIHLGIVKYGDSANSMTVERWTYTGRNLYNAYDTKQSFSDGYKDSVFSYLPPYLSHGRYSSPKSGMFYMKITKIYFKKLSRIICFLLGVFLSFVFLSIGHSDRKEHFQPISKVTTSKSDLNVDDLTIRSVSRYGNNINIVFNDSKGKYYTDKDLSSHGYLMTFIDACTILISKGEKDAKAHC